MLTIATVFETHPKSYTSYHTKNFNRRNIQPESTLYTFILEMPMDQITAKIHSPSPEPTDLEVGALRDFSSTKDCQPVERMELLNRYPPEPLQRVLRFADTQLTTLYQPDLTPSDEDVLSALTAFTTELFTPIGQTIRDLLARLCAVLQSHREIVFHPLFRTRVDEIYRIILAQTSRDPNETKKIANEALRNLDLPFEEKFFTGFYYLLCHIHDINPPEVVGAVSAMLEILQRDPSLTDKIRSDLQQLDLRTPTDGLQYYYSHYDDVAAKDYQDPPLSKQRFNFKENLAEALQLYLSCLAVSLALQKLRPIINHIHLFDLGFFAEALQITKRDALSIPKACVITGGVIHSIPVTNFFASCTGISPEMLRRHERDACLTLNL